MSLFADVSLIEDVSLRHVTPIDPSSMTRFRRRIGESGCELVPNATKGAGMASEKVRVAPTLEGLVLLCGHHRRLLHDGEFQILGDGIDGHYFADREGAAFQLHSSPANKDLITLRCLLSEK